MPTYPSLGLILLLTLTTAQAKPLALDKRWAIEAPDSWWYSEVSDRESLRVYTFGLGSPDPQKDAPVFLVDASMKSVIPQLVRGISMGIARKPVEVVVIQGTEKLTRGEKAQILKDGYRKEIETISGKLVLAVFVFTAQKLPGEPLPNPETRLVIVQIAGKSDAEVEDFAAIFETIKPWVDQK